MIRILLPLAVVAILLLTPLYGAQTSEVGGIVKPNTVTGMDYVGDTLKCWTTGNISLADDCAPAAGTLGLGIFASVLASAAAAVVGVLGLFPFVGRLTSAVTTLAGAVTVSAISYYIVKNLGSDAGIAGVQWGTFAAGGGGLLTLISGLSGMRGK